MRFANRQSGAVIIVVVGVLAVLSLLAVTFSRVMSVELRASANQSEADLARQFARAGLEFQRNLLRIAGVPNWSELDDESSLWHLMSQPEGYTLDVCEYTDPALRADSYGCKVVYEDGLIVGAVSFHDHHSDRGFFAGAGISDEDSKFNLNAMGSLEDVGTERDYRQRYSSFDASLARVIKASLDDQGIDINGGEEARYGFALWLARRIVRYRYGPSGRPGASAAAVANGEDRRLLEQRPAFALPFRGRDGDWTTAGVGDTGTGFPPPPAVIQNCWQEVGAGFYGGGDGFASYFTHRASDRSYGEAGVWRTYDSTTGLWNADTGVEILDGTGIGIGIEDRVPTGFRQPDGTLVLEAGLAEWDDEKGYVAAEFVPDRHYIAAKHADDAEYDDRLFRSNTQIVPIIREYIHELANATTGPLTNVAGRPVNPANEDSIIEAARTIYEATENRLTVHSYSWVGTSVNINGDWSMDGFDNNRDGYIDDDPRNPGDQEMSWNDILEIADPDDRAEAIQARLVALREGLGLVDANGIDQYGLSRKDINQIVVNIVDFADDNDVPTFFDDGDDSVYGSEGLHITEVMGAGEKITSTDGTEMTHDGTAGGDTEDEGWEWVPADNCWEMLDAGSVATFQFDVPSGWYAIRLRGGSWNDLIIDPAGDNISVTTDREEDGESWGYARDGDGKLYAVESVGGTLELRIEALTVYDRFYGVQLLPQYIEITNIAQQSPHRDTDHSIDISGFSLQATPTLGDEYIVLPGADPLVEPALVPPAIADGNFPINYGIFVVALSEEAYTRQWDIDPAAVPYPIYFLGDIDDDSADQMLFGPGALSVALWDTEGNPVAGGEIDGSIDLGLTPYRSKEKNLILTDHTRPQSDWWSDSVAIPGALSGSQHVEAYPDYRTNLNSVLPVWDAAAGYPTFKPLDDFRTSRQVFPIVLNRPYASPGWLGLVPAGRPFRTIDRDPDPVNNPEPEQLLGRLMSRATVGGVHARVNINTAHWTVLTGIMDGSYDPDNPDDPAVSYGSVKAIMDNRPFESWDDLLNTDALYDDTDMTHGTDATSPFWRFYNNDRLGLGGGNRDEDSGAGTYADDFPDDTDEQEEWARRYSNLIDIRSHTFRTRVDGLVFERGNPARPVGHARIEAVMDRGRDTDGDGRPNVRILEKRYITP